MADIKILGTLTGLAGDVLELAGRSGNPKNVALDAAKGAVVVAAPAGPARDAVLASVRHLEGVGSLRDALAAHLPHLPARPLAAALALIEGLTEAVADDGKIDSGEIMALVAAAVQELSQ